jgi:hypothetical protein
MAVIVYGSGSISGLTDITNLVGSFNQMGANGIIRTNTDTVAENLVIPVGTNGMSAGPVTVDTNYTVQILGTWTIV